MNFLPRLFLSTFLVKEGVRNSDSPHSPSCAFFSKQFIADQALVSWRSMFYSWRSSKLRRFGTGHVVDTANWRSRADTSVMKSYSRIPPKECELRNRNGLSPQRIPR